VTKIIRAEVNPELLTWSREYIGLDHDHAARKAGVSRDKLRSWEMGDSLPTLRQARLLAKAYKRPCAFFYLQDPPELPPELPDFRRLPDTERGLTPALVYEIQRTRFRQEIALQVNRSLGEQPQEFSLTVDQQAGPVQAGHRIREFLNVSIEEQSSWMTTHEALNSWIKAFDQAGVMVFQFSGIPVKNTRGFSVPDIYVPAISLNGADSAAGRVFTLLHELCHLAMGTGGICDLHENDDRTGIEVFCNAAAAEVLVPSGFFLEMEQVRNNPQEPFWDDDTLNYMSGYFKVSREVIIRLLLTLNKTNLRFYRSKRQEYIEENKEETGKGGGYFPYPRKVVRNNGPSFTALVLNAFHQQAITAIDVSRYLGDIRLNHLPAIQSELLRG